jgi:hypothetical protein
MSLSRSAQSSPLARAVDLGAAWNATAADVATRLHPRYGPALARLPDGPNVFRGLPFALGSSTAGRRWLLLDDLVEIAVPDNGAAGVSHLVVAHFCDSWFNEHGERPEGMPVGWVLPAGEPLATYTLEFADGHTRDVEIRRRFEIADGIIGWGFLPFEAVGHRADEPLDWRGPYPRQSRGRYAPAGHAGALGMLPASWGVFQTAVADFVPTPHDDITYWLHAIPIAPTETLASIRLAGLGRGRSGSAVVVAGITLFSGTANPLAWQPRRQLRIEGPAAAVAASAVVDLGVPIRALPIETHDAPGTDPRRPIGWGRPRRTPPADGPAAAEGSAAAEAVILDLAASADARLWLDGAEIPIAAIDDSHPAPIGASTIRALPAADVRMTVRILADGGPTAARVRFTSNDGRYLAPLGHRDEVNPALLEDTGADVLLGSDAYAYVAGEFQVDLPPGVVNLEVVKGFEFRPARTRLEVGAGSRDVSIDLERAVSLRQAGWRTADPHVHYIAPSTALVQAAAEDVAFVHVLATQAGDLVTNAQDLAWGSGSDPSGGHRVVMGTENRQNLLGHLTLLGARQPVLPMAAGGAPEGRLGGPVTELLSDWADRCHAAGGLVVGAHFPLPYAEIAAAIVAGRIDAIEMQTFAPRLDSPSIGEWYRFLNCGERLPVLGGTDKMSAEVPVGAIRTYARLGLDEPPTFEAWAAAVRAGRTFATSGPLIELAVDGHEPGDVIRLPSSGGRLEVRAGVRAGQPVITALEIVMDGAVVGRETAPSPTASLELALPVDVRRGAWIAARSLSDHEIHSAFATAMAGHTSAVYVEVVDHPAASPEDAEAIARVIDGSARWLETLAAVAEPADRARMVDQIRDAAEVLRRRASAAARDGG